MTKTAHLPIRSALQLDVIVDHSDLPALLQGKWYLIPQGPDTLKFRVKGRLPGSQKLIYLHHAILGVPEKGMVIDHIDGNPLNNSRTNLRVVTLAENQQNRQKANKNSKTGIKGIHPSRKKFRVVIEKDGKIHCKEGFASIQDAQEYLCTIL